MAGYVYILASAKRGTLYIGVTSDLSRRIYQHKNKFIEGFTSRYNVDILVHFEEYNNIRDAIDREKALKRYKREWKIALIEASNRDWKDLPVY
jgi:putative endonuclease